MLYRFVLVISCWIQLTASSDKPSHSPHYQHTHLLHVPEPEIETDRKTNSARGAITQIPITHSSDGNSSGRTAQSARSKKGLSREGYRKCLRERIITAQTSFNVGASVIELNTYLLSAASEGFTDLVELALKTGAHIDAYDKRGFTAIHRAVMSLPAPEVCLLTDRGTDGLASKYFELINTIELLLTYKPNLSVSANNGYRKITVAETAMLNEQFEIICLLAREGVFENQDNGSTRHKREDSSSKNGVRTLLALQNARAVEIGCRLRQESIAQLPQRAALIKSSILLPKELISIIQGYAGLPYKPFDPIDIIKQTQKLEKDADRCCSESCTIL